MVAAKAHQPASSSSEGGNSDNFSGISEGISGFISGMTELAQGVAKELQEVRIGSNSPSRDSTTVSISELQDKLNSRDEKLFLEWLATFDLDSKMSEISSLLASNESVLALHQQLVPSELSSEEFWGRYFYKTEQATKKEKDRQQLLSKMASKVSEADLSWDDDDVEETPASLANMASEGAETSGISSPPPSLQSPSIETPDSGMESSIDVHDVVEATGDTETQNAGNRENTFEDSTSSAAESVTTPVNLENESKTENVVPPAQSVQPKSVEEAGEDVFGWN